MKTRHSLVGPIVITNEVTFATQLLLDAFEHVGPGELKDSEKEILALADERPRDRELLVVIAAEVRRRVW